MMAEARHLSWGAAALWKQLEPELPGLSVEVLARAESTNTLLLDRVRQQGGRRAEGGEAARSAQVGRRDADIGPCLLVAEQQTHGRGRLGRGWVAAPGVSLTFSLALTLAPADWSGLSLAVGVALADALDPLVAGTAPRLVLKWPNDLWLREAPGRGRKLGGILIETVGVEGRRVCVIGVGLNVLALPAPAASMSCGQASVQELDPRASPPSVLARVALPLVQAVRSFERRGFGAFAAAYAARDLLHGVELTTTAADCPAGRGAGVDAQGALIVLDAAGQRHRLVSGEISVRPQAGDEDGAAAASGQPC